MGKAVTEIEKAVIEVGDSVTIGNIELISLLLGIVVTFILMYFTIKNNMRNEYKERIDFFKDRISYSENKPLTSSKRGNPTRSNYEVYKDEEIIKFYDLIAKFYNARNTGYYGISYEKIYSNSIKYFKNLDSKRICDLGGGTGFLLNKFKHHDVHWTNIDLSINAINIFRKEHKDFRKKNSIFLDIRENYILNQKNKFDIIILSFVLSSMNDEPCWKRIIECLDDNGIIIIADNYYDYVRNNEYYAFKDIGKKDIAIKPKPMYPKEIKKIMDKFNLIEFSYEVIHVNNTKLNMMLPYSQIHVYKKKSGH